MAKPRVSILPDRGVISVHGGDARSFLQGIVSNDADKVTADRAGYGAFLTPQGKYLFDFFMSECDGIVIIETERDRIADFIKRLNLYKLRADVALEDASERYKVLVAFGQNALNVLSLESSPGHCMSIGDGHACTDPRLPEAGARIILPNDDASAMLNDPTFEPVDASIYDAHRIMLGLPDSSRDMIIDKSVLLENGFDELNGIDWQKGCYMGQEVTARTKHRGLLKKRLMPVSFEGAAPDPGTAIMAGDREIGEMRSSCDSMGLALIKLEYLDKDAKPSTPLTANGSSLTPVKPSWMTL